MEIMKSPAPHRKRMRAHAVLLSERHYSIDQIADIYQVDRDSVSLWIDWWEEHKVDGLDDDPSSGRPPKLNVEERQRAIEIDREGPLNACQDFEKMTEAKFKVIWSVESIYRIAFARPTMSRCHFLFIWTEFTIKLLSGASALQL